MSFPVFKYRIWDQVVPQMWKPEKGRSTGMADEDEFEV